MAIYSYWPLYVTPGLLRWNYPWYSCSLVGLGEYFQALAHKLYPIDYFSCFSQFSQCVGEYTLGFSGFWDLRAIRKLPFSCPCPHYFCTTIKPIRGLWEICCFSHVLGMTGLEEKFITYFCWNLTAWVFSLLFQLLFLFHC